MEDIPFGYGWKCSLLGCLFSFPFSFINLLGIFPYKFFFPFLFSSWSNPVWLVSPHATEGVLLCTFRFIFFVCSKWNANGQRHINNYYKRPMVTKLYFHSFISHTGAVLFAFRFLLLLRSVLVPILFDRKKLFFTMKHANKHTRTHTHAHPHTSYE